MSLQEVFRDICTATATRLEAIEVNEINFQFGDSVYINNQMKILAGAQERRYPLICLYPFIEEKLSVDYECVTKVDLIIACRTVSDYDNWQRHDISFKGFLRVIYGEFMEHVKLFDRFDFGGAEVVEHLYKENYAWGSRGVMDSEKKEFPDLIDAIEIKNLKIKLLKEKCDGTSKRVW